MLTAVLLAQYITSQNILNAAYVLKPKTSRTHFTKVFFDLPLYKRCFFTYLRHYHDTWIIETPQAAKFLLVSIVQVTGLVPNLIQQRQAPSAAVSQLPALTSAILSYTST
jgi:hypothetical protein